MVDLRTVREKKKLTQQELADKVGVSRQAITNIETGANKPSVELAMKIADVLKFKWYKLFE